MTSTNSSSEKPRKQIKIDIDSSSDESAALVDMSDEEMVFQQPLSYHAPSNPVNDVNYISTVFTNSSQHLAINSTSNINHNSSTLLNTINTTPYIPQNSTLPIVFTPFGQTPSTQSNVIGSCIINPSLMLNLSGIQFSTDSFHSQTTVNAPLKALPILTKSTVDEQLFKQPKLDPIKSDLAIPKLTTQQLQAALLSREKVIEDLKRKLSGKQAGQKQEQPILKINNFSNEVSIKNSEILRLQNEIANYKQKIIHCQVIGKKSSTEKKNSPKKSTSVIFPNLDLYLKENKEFTKFNLSDGFVIYCNLCRKAGKKLSKMSKGLTFIGEQAANIEKGSSKYWFKLRDTLRVHLDFHKLDRIKFSAAENILTVFLTSVKATNSSTCDGSNYVSYFGNWLSTAKLLGIDIGKSRIQSAGQILTEMRCYAMERIEKFLKNNTYFFTVEIDWFRFRHETNALISIVINIDGEMRSIPIDCRIVSSELVTAKTVDEHSDAIWKSLKSRLDFSESDFQRMSSLGTDKRSPMLHTNLKRKLKLSDAFFFNVFSISDWLDSILKSVFESQFFFQLFLKRTQQFQMVFKLQNEDDDKGEMFSKLFCIRLEKDLKTFIESYYSMEFLNRFEDDRIEHIFFIRGRDFLLDLCLLRDFFEPISNVVRRLADRTGPIWKITKLLPTLLDIFQEMKTNLDMLVINPDMSPNGRLFPCLTAIWKRTIGEKFSYDEWFVTQTKFDNEDPLWNIRDLKDFLGDYVKLCSALHGKLSEIHLNNVPLELKQLQSCFDLETMLDEILAESVDSSTSELRRIFRLEKFFQSGLSDFQRVFVSLGNRLQERLNISSTNVSDLFQHWKELVYNSFFQKQSTHSLLDCRWFVNKKSGTSISLDDEIARIESSSLDLVKTDGLLSKPIYRIYLKNGIILDGIQFVETEFMRFLLSSCGCELFQTFDRSLYSVIDYAFSFYRSEQKSVSFDRFHSALIRHSKGGIKSRKRLLDSVFVDCLYPCAVECKGALSGLGRQLVSSGKLFPTKTKKVPPSRMIKNLHTMESTIQYPFVVEDSSDENDDVS